MTCPNFLQGQCDSSELKSSLTSTWMCLTQHSWCSRAWRSCLSHPQGSGDPANLSNWEISPRTVVLVEKLLYSLARGNVSATPKWLKQRGISKIKVVAHATITDSKTKMCPLGYNDWLCLDNPWLTSRPQPSLQPYLRPSYLVHLGASKENIAPETAKGPWLADVRYKSQKRPSVRAWLLAHESSPCV